jgi:ribosome-binding protein aMBF1 (putative translation factor)
MIRTGKFYGSYFFENFVTILKHKLNLNNTNMSVQVSQDWDSVVIRKRSNKPKSNEDAFRAATMSGEAVDTVKKFNAGKNTSNAKQPVISARKLETDEEFTLPKVSHNLALKIQQARLAAGLTQKELGNNSYRLKCLLYSHQNK